ncbi:sulfur carrier protein ThiS [Actinobacillus pleuropneumoniae]|uniref:Thiamine biosynthesis protein ThiS n=2 Tax=Actinobacillus pleuropneumoniae TaxID=715 RepID=B3GX73_ACTP7|nr:sulfur carrier protein ThiS [Actinobacillus pleuropneumoniae]ACE61225.1 thiamine biosynthesis protein ThiS [Actinobacillus pleuropneumoniae serovar 7 str. AP76]EFM90319.1 Thiamine biosynthesis protein ThiS [Actinobacillus pleuropneumoniae serovar 4 str. M62]EFN01078.1 Thiamine biosynthesis protein ThiS [Actinobacillus pleuropneumoniae serovar 12 str. 1096]EFN03248.1 Thiamine biosynthesis protein ThiS [Actinobacillus pleuropneumoniae serovar 13 str. N273]MBT9318969.1 sulfur carrier protein T
MQIFINNQPLDVAENTSIQTALALSQANLQGVAVALNQQIVPKNEWQSYPLQEGAKLTVFKAIAGG